MRFWALRLPLAFPESDPLLPNPDSNTSRGITCEFCECGLTPAGELKGRLSGKARKLRDLEESNAALTEKLEAAQATIAQLKTELSAAVRQPTPEPEPAAVARSRWQE